MILQLMRRSGSFQQLAGLLLVLTIAAWGSRFIPVPPDRAGGLQLAWVFGFALTGIFILALALTLQAQRAPFEAALPIARRDLWLSQGLTLLSLVWLPAVAVAACGWPLVPIFEVSAVLTALALAAKCVRPGESGSSRLHPARMIQVMAVSQFLFIVFRNYLRSLHWPAMPPPEIVFAAAGLASLGLFAYGLLSVPKSFQFAPADSPLEATREPSRFIWTPVFLSLVSMKRMGILFFFVIGFMGSGQHGVGVMAAIPYVSLTRDCRWLMPLPVSARKLFALSSIPVALAILIGALLRQNYAAHPLTPQAWFIAFAAELSGAYAVIFLLFLASSPQFSRLPAWLRWCPYASTYPGLPALAAFFPDSFNWLAPALPIAWWLAMEAFARREYRRPYIESVNFSREVLR